LSFNNDFVQDPDDGQRGPTRSAYLL